MITVSIDRTSLSLTALSITDTGADAYSIMPGVQIGGGERDNVYAESRWIDGAAVTSSRATLTTIDLNVRVEGSSLADLQTKIAALAAALAQFTYTVTVTEGATATTYDCCPGSWRRQYNQTAMMNLADYLTVTIPRQP